MSLFLTPYRYECECPNGYEGSKCEKDRNECAANPCQHEARCIDLLGYYRCDCKPGYTGKLHHCHTHIYIKSFLLDQRK